jgi:hypothetical protein
MLQLLNYSETSLGWSYKNCWHSQQLKMIALFYTYELLLRNTSILIIGFAKLI